MIIILGIVFYLLIGFSLSCVASYLEGMYDAGSYSEEGYAFVFLAWPIAILIFIILVSFEAFSNIQKKIHGTARRKREKEKENT